MSEKYYRSQLIAMASAVKAEDLVMLIEAGAKLDDVNFDSNVKFNQNSHLIPIKMCERKNKLSGAFITPWILSQCLALLLLLLLLLFFLSARSLRNVDVQEKEEILGKTIVEFDSNPMEVDSNLDLAGQYIQSEVGDDFEDYLVSLKMPRILASMMTQITEIVHIRREGQHWTLRLSRGGEETVLQFELNRPFNTTIMADNSVITHLCSRPSTDRLECTLIQKERQLHLLSQMVFDEDGYIDYKTNLNNGVSSYKAFAKVHGTHHVDQQHVEHRADGVDEAEEVDRRQVGHHSEERQDYIDQLPLDFWN